MQTSRYILNDTEAERGPEGYRAIDGNWLKSPVGYCSYHHGYLTARLIKTHKCHKKHGGTCVRFHTMEGENVKRMRQDQFYDKALDRMQKLEASINRAVRSLDRIAEALEQEPETPLDKAVRQARDDSFFGGVEAIEQDAKEWENIHR